MITSFDIPPVDGEAVHQVIDPLIGILGGVRSEVGILGGSQNAAVAQDLLDLQQVKTGLDQMGRVAVSQAVGCDLFFIPQASATLRSVI